MSGVFKTTIGTGAPAPILVSGTMLYGMAATSAEAAPYYVKLFWSGSAVAPAASPSAPVVGTTVPSMTLPVPTTGQPLTPLAVPVLNGGQLWMWVTKNAADSDATALTTGGDVISLLVG